MHILLLASQDSRKSVSQFWKHLVPTMSRKPEIVWQIVYVEKKKISAPDDEYIVIACLDRSLMVEIVSRPELQELVSSAKRAIPFIFSRCTWDYLSSPFQGKSTLVREIVSESTNKDTVFFQASNNLLGVL